MTITQEQLEPCPFCGGAAAMTRWRSINSGRDYHRVYCDAPNPPGCPAEPFVDDEVQTKAIAAWNRRSSSLVSEVERLREALEKAAGQFEFYAREHRAKAQAINNANDTQYSAALSKAQTNERFALMCRAALTQEQ